MSALTPPTDMPTPTTDKITQAAMETIYLCKFRVSMDGEWLCLRELDDISLTPDPEPTHEGMVRSQASASLRSVLVVTGTGGSEGGDPPGVYCRLLLSTPAPHPLSLLTGEKISPYPRGLLSQTRMFCYSSLSQSPSKRTSEVI